MTKSDLISRQDAIEALGEKPVGESDWDLGCRNQWEWDTEILRSMPSAEQERKWISVTEALPKVKTDVLLAFEKNMAVGFYSHGCWNVNTGNGFYTGVFTDEDKPIAWMPLPEPWKGE